MTNILIKEGFQKFHFFPKKENIEWTGIFKQISNKQILLTLTVNINRYMYYMYIHWVDIFSINIINVLTDLLQWII